jgi:hypothetical protein
VLIGRRALGYPWGMRTLRALAVSVGLAVAAVALAQQAPEPAFADVPPCHWAAEAVNRLADKGIFIGFPPEPAYLSVNALRQVFEGLRCQDPSWSLRFLAGAPVGFGQPPAPRLAGFELAAELLELAADRARIAFAVTLVLDDASGRRIETRQGEAVALRDGLGWRVAYESLEGLEPALFVPAGPQATRPATPSATFRGE